MERIEKDGSKDMTYIQHFAGRNYFVDKIIPSTCGGCGKLLRRSGNENTGYLCRKCSPRPKKVLNETNCTTCKFLADCTARLGAGAWVRCELPDEGDLRRLLGDQRFSDQTVRPPLQAALAGEVDRVALETAVSRSASRIYQQSIERVYPPKTE
jgi:hypothetical protein